jgi:hypothetical protein
MSALRVLIGVVATLSVLVGAVFSIMALGLTIAVRGEHLVLLHCAGAFLFAVVAVHLLPLALIKRRAGLVLYAVGAIAAAAAFGVLYYFATIDDPFRSEGELFEDVPFLLAAWLCFLPLARASLRFICLGSTTVHVTQNA